MAVGSDLTGEKRNVIAVIVEENSPGGFSAHVMQYLANAGHLDRGLVVRCMSLPTGDRP